MNTPVSRETAEQVQVELRPIEFTLLESTRIEDLNASVSDHLQRGYRLHGEVHVVQEMSQDVRFVQLVLGLAAFTSDGKVQVLFKKAIPTILPAASVPRIMPKA